MESNLVGQWQATRNIELENHSLKIGDKFQIIEAFENGDVIVRKNQYESKTTASLLQSVAKKVF